MRRVGRVGLAVIGPASVGLLRFLLPYYTADDSPAAARAVQSGTGRESAVLWLGLLATLTLVPGLYAARDGLAPGRLRSWSFGLTLVGYLCLPVVLVGDAVLWVTAAQGVDPGPSARLLDGLHPSYGVAVAMFVVAHVVGTTLIGVLCLRSRALPVALGWALALSQPMHFVATVFLGLAWVDLVAWMLTALAMGWLAAQVLDPRTTRVAGMVAPTTPAVGAHSART